MFVIILTGIFSALTIRTQIMPDVQLDRITIQVPFPGASPGEVETGVVIRVEEAVRDIEGIVNMRSFANPSSGTVELDIETAYDALAVLDEVKRRLTGLRTSRLLLSDPTFTEINLSLVLSACRFLVTWMKPP